MSEGMRRGITLRATLAALVCGAALYVAAIAAVIGFRIAPTASSLRRHGEAMQAEFAAVRERAAMLRATYEEARLLLSGGGGQQVDPGKPAAARALLARLRPQLDDTRAVASAQALGGLPGEMRVALGGVADAESQLGGALVEVLSLIELGSYREASASLARCEGLNDYTSARLADVLGLGLADLIERQRGLSAAADTSIRAIGWWAGGGLALVPLLALFIHRRFYRPLAALDDGLAQVAAGRLDMVVPVRRTDELGRLGAHFNEMTGVLRQRAAEAERESEERYRAIFEQGLDGIVLADCETGRFAEFNQRAHQNLGYARAEFAALTAAETEAAPPPGEPADRLRRVARGGTEVYETRLRTKDGRVRDVLVSARHLTLKGREYVLAFQHDITERQRAEREAEERARFERLISRLSADFINVSARDCDAAIGRALGAVADFTEADRGYVFQFSDDMARLDFTHEYCAPGVPATIGRFPDHQARPRSWVYWRHRRGETIIMRRLEDLPPEAAAEREFYREQGLQSILCVPLQVAGAVLGFVGFDYLRAERDWSPGLVSQLELVGQIFANALARKRADESLRLSEEKFAKAFRSSPDGITMSTIEEGLLLEVNDSFERMYGYRRDEVLGRTSVGLGIWVDPAQRARMRDMLRRDGSISNWEAAFRTKQGAVITVLLSAEVVDLGGRPVLLSLVRDITERKRVEQELEQSLEQLRALSDHLQQVREEERTHIAREIHDELGQALTALKVDLSWVAEKMPPGEPRLAGRLEAMLGLSDSIIETVQKISTELRPGILDNLGLTAAIEWQTQEFESRTGIRCRLGELEEVDDLDQARATACFRILQETLTNVARHAGATAVEIGLRRQAGSLMLHVRDNGRGITEYELADRASIGLLGMRERAHALGGDLFIRGEAGAGTAVTVSIPLN